MLLIKAEHIYVEYLGRDVLDIDQLELYDYDRIGLVGANGAGKAHCSKRFWAKSPYSKVCSRGKGKSTYIPQVGRGDCPRCAGLRHYGQIRHRPCPNGFHERRGRDTAKDCAGAL